MNTETYLYSKNVSRFRLNRVILNEKEPVVT